MADSTTKDFKIEQRFRQLERLRALLMELPDFCYDYFVAIEPNTTILTRINYAGDLRIFFQYMVEIGVFSEPIREITPEQFGLVTTRHMETYLDYLSQYEKENDVYGHVHTYENQNLGKKRKLAALRTLCKFMLKNQMIDRDPSALLETPKIREKAIIHLEKDEINDMFNAVETGEGLTEKQRAGLAKTRLRDMAIITLLLGTGIRISELTGLDLHDIDFRHNSFIVTRKGGKTALLYFSDEVKGALQDYWEQRQGISPLPGFENALFLSGQRRRITERAVQNLVEKFAKCAVPLKHITPHKFRSTFGTALYRETGDIYLVADVLGHADVNTTRRHYAQMSDENRRKAATAVHLFPEKDENE